MIIKTLRLVNFKKHADITLNFTLGLNGIFGNNYKGKTSILHGIMFCLGGVTALPKGVSVENDMADKGSPFKQTLLIGDDEKDFLIVRTKTDAKIYEGSKEDKEKVIATGVSAVNARVEKLLGMDMKTFRALRYAEQKKADSILTLGAAKLHAIVDKVTGVDEVNAAITAVTAIASGAAQALEIFPKVDGLEDMVAQLERVTTEQGKLENALAEIKEKTAEEKEILTKAQKELKTFEENSRLATQELHNNSLLIQRISAAQELVAEEEETLAQLEKSHALLREHAPDDLQEQIDAVRETRDNILSEKERVKYKTEQVDKSRQRVTALSEDVTQAEKDLTIATETAPAMVAAADLDAARERKENAAANVTVVKAKISEAKAALTEGVCSLCHRAFDGCEDQKEHYETMLKESEAALVELSAEVRAATTALEKLNSEVAFRAQYDASVAKKQERLENVKAELSKERECLASLLQSNSTVTGSDLEVALKEADETLRILVIEYNNLSLSENSLRKAKARLDKAKEAIASYAAPLSEKKVAELTVWLDDVSRETLEKAVAVSLDKVQIAERETVATTLHLEQAIAERVRLEKEAEEVEELRAKVEAMERREAAAKGLLKFLRDNRDRYSETIWAKFTASASSFCAGCTEGRIDGLVRDGDGDFSYTEEGKRRAVEDASGAQKAIIGLGVQAALAASAFCPLRLIIVDEPTADMDAEHALATTLMLAASERQVITVSHSRLDATACANTIEL